MPLPELIGLGGYAQSGKDTAAALLRLQHGYQHTYMSRSLELALLALNPLVPPYPARAFGPLKDYVRYRDLHELVGYEMSKQNTEVRALLQRLGTDVGRDLLGEDTWVNATFTGQVDPGMADGERFAVTGIRFPNELDAIHLRGGLSVWVNRGLRPINAHPSDNALGPEDFDTVLDNKGTVADLAVALRALVSP